MRKLNKGGFFLAETIVVIAIAAAVLVLFYKQISNLYTNYDYTVKYNTVQDIHAANNLKKFIYQEGQEEKDELIAALGANSCLDITSYSNFTDPTYYANLLTQSNIRKLYLTPYNINNLISNAVSNNFSASFIKYLKTLSLIDTSNTAGKYRIIIELNDNTFTNIIISGGDIKPPVITMNNASNNTVDIGAVYSDPGATALDNVDGTIPNGSITKTGSVNPNVPGTYKITYTVSDAAGNAAVPVTRTIYVFEYDYAYDYTGSSQSFTVPHTGTYQIQAWGARGGQGLTNNVAVTAAGKGAYASGNVTLQQGAILYAYVGNIGATPPASTFPGAAGGWNGGAAGGADSNQDAAPEPGGGGGGATDIRLVSGAWNDTTGLRSRILIAAGGGGSEYNGPGGGGGTLSGLAGNNNPLTPTQIAGAAFGSGSAGASCTAGGGGGAGGYWGGYGGGVACAQAGSGGSSFVSGCTNCNAIDSSGAATGQPNHFSSYVFSNISMIDGATSMPAPAGGTETGHNTTGYIKITYIP